MEKGFRCPTFVPRSPDEDLIRIALWAQNPLGSHRLLARGRALRPRPCRPDSKPPPSHRPRRLGRKSAKGVRLLREEPSQEDLEERPDYLVTSPLRTFLDVARSPRISPEHLEIVAEQAIEQGLGRALTAAESEAGVGA